MTRWLISLMVLAWLTVSSTTAGLSESPSPKWKTSPGVTSRLLTELNANGEADVLVFIRSRPDLTPARALATREAKGRFVFEALRRTAEKAQADLRRLLDARGVEYQAFWIVNMLRVWADRALVSELEGRPEVRKLDVNLNVLGLQPDPGVFRNPFSWRKRVSKLTESTPPWGIASVGAPLVWEQGILGQGIVVAGNDTGVDWRHEALRGAYRGWSGASVDHNYNWHDAIHANDPHTSSGNPCGFDSLEPCDDNGHGTHTIGTVAGSGPQQIGVAPGARWMACRNMEEGWGTPASYVECFQFFLAPTDLGGNNPQPDLAPHIVNNSWACVESEGCYPGDSLWGDTIRPAVEALTEAGIAVVVSVGNSGPGCQSVWNPPAIYPQSLTVGAIQQNLQIASFSSRGPVTIGGSELLAPDLAAPGREVLSSVPGDHYTTMNGTSMAAPHVAGTIALLWSAEPQLVGRLAVTEQVLRASATSVPSDACGGGPDGQPNNSYGWGIINADAAIRAGETLQELAGTVTDVAGIPLAGVEIQVTDLTWEVEVNLLTGADGHYVSPLLAGQYRVLADTAAHFAASAVVTVPADSPATHDIALIACVDWDGDGQTGVFEIQQVAGDWHRTDFDPGHDINRDGILNVIDLAILTAHFDELCSGPAL